MTAPAWRSGRDCRDAGLPFVFEGGMEPERVLPRVRDLGCETIVFLDAVDVAAKPGSVVVMDALEIVGRFPQISTHKLSLGTLAKLVAGGNESRVFLIGIQPETIALDGPAAFTPKGLHLQAQGHAAHPGDSQDDAFTPKGLHPQAQGRAAHPGVSQDEVFVTPKGLNKGERLHY